MEVQKIFPLTQTKMVFFLSPNSFKKLKFTRGKNFFPQRPNFSSGLAEKFSKKLATLARLLKKGIFVTTTAAAGREASFKWC
jgi:hypothetical protein